MMLIRMRKYENSACEAGPPVPAPSGPECAASPYRHDQPACAASVVRVLETDGVLDRRSGGPITRPPAAGYESVAVARPSGMGI